ncbi:MAG: hypothetical protein ACM3N0_11075 [Chloroflexota bacterium]
MALVSWFKYRPVRPIPQTKASGLSATLVDGRGGRRYAPYVFTEQGVADALGSSEEQEGCGGEDRGSDD